jgi:hypothetical protein
MAGTITSSRTRSRTTPYSRKFTKVITVDWVADAADGSVPALSLPLSGYLIKVVTNPGATAPTANYDIALNDPSDSALNVWSTALDNRHTTNTEQVYPAISGAVTPILLNGTYSLAVSGNAVNSATGQIQLYLVEL